MITAKERGTPWHSRWRAVGPVALVASAAGMSVLALLATGCSSAGSSAGDSGGDAGGSSAGEGGGAADDSGGTGAEGGSTPSDAGGGEDVVTSPVPGDASSDACVCASPEAGSGACQADSDCGDGGACGYLESAMCAAVGTCVAKSGPVACLVYQPGCTCSGSEVDIACNGLPSGYAPAPLRHAGACGTDGG